MSVLSVHGLEKRFGGVTALAGCSLEIAAPGVYGLIGPNGAGKTTLFDAITGITEPDAGHVEFRGRNVTKWAPHRLAALGIARTFQECRVFPEFSCLDNLLFAPRLSRRESEREAQALRLLRMVNLERYAHEPAAILSFGQRRLLEIVAIFLAEPALLLLDEPAAGVNPALLEVLAAFVRRMYEEQPRAFLIVEHNMEFIMALASEIVVMHQGAVLERGAPQAVRASARVIEAYLG